MTWILIKFGLPLVLVVSIYAAFSHMGNKLQAAIDYGNTQNERVTASETLRKQCNMEVAGLNATMATQAAVSELEQIEREKLTENLDAEREKKATISRRSRNRALQIQAAVDCAAEPLRHDLISLSDHARAAANQHPRSDNDL